METIIINDKEYQLDIDKAKEQGLLKEKDDKPRDWTSYCIQTKHNIYDYDSFDDIRQSRAFCALGKLIQLRNAWWGDWRPDWENSDTKYVICTYQNKIDIFGVVSELCILAFPTEEMRNDFLETFRDLIEKAKMFL